MSETPHPLSEKATEFLLRAVLWFDRERPQWGPGTLPTWYVDARYLLEERGLYKTRTEGENHE